MVFPAQNHNSEPSLTDVLRNWGMEEQKTVSVRDQLLLRLAEKFKDDPEMARLASELKELGDRV